MTAFVVMAHPSRITTATQIAQDIGGVVVEDPDPYAKPSAWRCAQRAWVTAVWEAMRTDDLWACVVQDDAQPCPDFRKSVQAALDVLEPDCLVSFYYGATHHGRQAVMQAKRLRQTFAMLPPGYVPTLALAMPVALAAQMLEDTQDDDRPWDDEVIGDWRVATKRNAYVSVPSLANHDNNVPSVMEHHDHGTRLALHRPPRFDGGQIKWRKPV